MPSALTKRALQSVGSAGSGFTRAKKLADLAVKTNTDSKGNPTARGYEEAAALLAPYIGSSKENEAIDAQRLVAQYNNNLDKLSGKERTQNETVSAFKLQENDAYFTSFDGDFGGLRDPSMLVSATSQSLDNLVLGVINAIDEKEATGESTDTLYGYLNDLQNRADAMRDLNNKYENGELASGQVLDGFGYYVDTNPLDGSVRGAALLPVGNVPEGMVSGYKRLDATTKIGDSLLPVYAPAQRNSAGEYVARVGDATWNGTETGALRAGNASQSKFLFAQGGFDISDRNLFQVKTNTVDKGSFGSGLIGRDEQGNPIESIVYRGMDGKLYNVDNATLEKFKQDPVLNQKLSGYVPRFSPTEMRELSKTAVPITEDRLAGEAKISGFQNDAASAQAESDRLNNMGFFAKVGTGLKNLNETGGGIFKSQQEAAANKARNDANNPSFFAAKNRPNKPEEAPTGGAVGNIIDSGKKFFKQTADKVTSFFGGR